MAAKRGSSVYTSEYAYDIFLSFRGEDTRKIFTTRLYSALMDAGFSTFIDDSGIERGEDIKSELIRAIHHSRGSIVVLSENYANSSWCLDELAMIVENKKSKGHVILPVFYHVTPSQVRKQIGSFAKAFARYEELFIVEEKDEKKKSQWMNKVNKWKAALKEVAGLEGMTLRLQDQDDERHETRFIQKIIKVIDDKLNRAVLTGVNDLIGVHSRVKKINQWIDNVSSDVSILAICGAGGIGKTTIAKFVYNLNYAKFRAHCFVANVREISKQPNGLVCLQTELLSGIQNGKKETINSVGEGIFKIKDAVLNKMILLVLDDIDQADQLNIVLGMREWFHPGSKVILTTREEHLFKPNKAYQLHRVEPLNFDESLQLFSLYAFGQDHPVEAFMDLSTRVLDRCEGLPLALKVLGSSLSGRSRDVWESELEKLNEIANNRIQKILRISYDTLSDDHDKNLFLHIACFFVGKRKDYIVTVLDECSFYTAVGIQSLIDRCLLSIEFSDILSMHQMIQDMGREVVRQESPRNPGKRSRLWRCKDSFNVLRDKSATDAIEGLVLDMRFLQESVLDAKGDGLCVHASALYKSDELNVKTDAFTMMNKLKLLQLNYVQLNGSYNNLPRSLKWLCWHGFPSKLIPSVFPLESLVALDMSYSKLKYWKLNKVAGLLKILDLSHSHELLCTPNFSEFSNLEKLILKDCVSLSEVHDSIGSLKRLVLLNLEDCGNLKKLPNTIAVLEYLETLVISGCSSLGELPMEMKGMTSLKVLDADGFATQRLLSLTKDVNSWHSCFWSFLSKPRQVPQISFTSLPSSLVSLSLSECNLSETAFPVVLCNLVYLQELNLSRNPLTGLPNFISGLSNLQKLNLDACTMLQSLQGLPDIETLTVAGCSSLVTITNLSTSSKVQNIQTIRCENLTEVQGLFSLKPFRSSNVKMLRSLGIFNLESIPNSEVNLQDGITFSTKKRPLQLLYEFGITSTTIPGWEVPIWFSNKNTGSSISFAVPSHPKGLNICCVYEKSDSNCVKEAWFPEHQLFAKVYNKTKNLTWIYFPTCFGIPEVEQDLLWLSYWTFQNQLESGDEVNVSIISGDSFYISECGINFGQEEDTCDINNILAWNEVIGGDLSAFRLSTGVYYLCRTTFLRNYEEEGISRPDDWTITKWGTNLFEGGVDFE
ncbi:hypothetical protein RD792_018146, partial [Penstemon davidsonii]